MLRELTSPGASSTFFQDRVKGYDLLYRYLPQIMCDAQHYTPLTIFNLGESHGVVCTPYPAILPTGSLPGFCGKGALYPVPVNSCL